MLSPNKHTHTHRDKGKQESKARKRREEKKKVDVGDDEDDEDGWETVQRTERKAPGQMSLQVGVTYVHCYMCGIFQIT